MKNGNTWLIIFLCFVLYLLTSRLIILRFFPEIQVVTSKFDIDIKELAKRLDRLEPKEPNDIHRDLTQNTSLPKQITPITDIIQYGKDIPIQTIYSNQDWQRPIYKAYWHSSNSDGRYSYVPHRLYMAMHKIFCTYPSAPTYYDFVHDIGLAEESKLFEHTDSIYTPDRYLHVFVMSTKINTIKTQKNQIVVVGEPSPTGLHVLLIPLSHLTSDPTEPLFIQLSTPDGYEIDYTLSKIMNH